MAADDERSRAARTRTAMRATNRRPELLRAVRTARDLLPGEPATDQETASRELAQTALQLWQALSQRSDSRRGSVEATLMFAELCDFAAWVIEVGDELALEVLREVASAVEPAVTAGNGRVVKHLGAGHMAVFASAADGLDAALEIQRRVQTVVVAGHRPKLAVGLHCGAPHRMAGDYLGADVNLTARLSEAAGGGEVLVSRPLLEALEPQQREGLQITRRRGFRGKGAPRDLEVFCVAAPD